MDLYCPKCGEPCDIDELHEVTDEKRSTFAKVLTDFQTRGCKAILSECNEPSTEVDRSFGLTRQEAASAMYELLGDDVDGCASMLEDMGF